MIRQSLNRSNYITKNNEITSLQRTQKTTSTSTLRPLRAAQGNRKKTGVNERAGTEARPTKSKNNSKLLFRNFYRDKQAAAPSVDQEQ
jgi:hypothetical protein